MKLDSSDARNRIAFATSRASPTRLSMAESLIRRFNRGLNVRRQMEQHPVVHLAEIFPIDITAREELVRPGLRVQLSQHVSVNAPAGRGNRNRTVDLAGKRA